MLNRIYGMKAFMALGAKNFRIFIFGQSVSLVGTWMQRLAMSWLVLRLTDSATGLGLVELSNQAPILVTGFFCRFDPGSLRHEENLDNHPVTLYDPGPLACFS